MRAVRRICLFTIAVSALVVPLLAQRGDDSPRFEVVSIKRNTSVGDSGRSSGPATPQFRVVNVPVRFVLLDAFDVKDHQLIGAPEWTRSEAYDITATYPPGVDRAASYRQMTQRMLADRFGLAFHRDRRELEGYRLVLARKDRRLGPQLVPSTVDCDAWLAEKRPQAGAGGTSPVAPDGKRPACMMIGTRTFITGGTRSIDQLTPALQSIVGRPVWNQTGLTGTFDIDVKWTSGPSVETRATDRPSDDTGASIFTAIEEQLGLKLEPATAPVDVVVIDRIERPAPD